MSREALLDSFSGLVQGHPGNIPVEPRVLLDTQGGQAFCNSVASLDQATDDGRGYFSELIRTLVDLDAPVGVRPNRRRKSLEGGCDEASQIRWLFDGERFGGEIKTLGLAWRNNGGPVRVGFVHLPAEAAYDKSLVGAAFGVAKNKPGRATATDLSEAGLGHLGNGLLNPFIALSKPPDGMIHVVDAGLVDRLSSGWWTQMPAPESAGSL